MIRTQTLAYDHKKRLKTRDTGPFSLPVRSAFFMDFHLTLILNITIK